MSNKNLDKLNDLISIAFDLQASHEHKDAETVAVAPQRPVPPPPKSEVEKFWSSIRRVEKFRFSPECSFSHSSEIGEKFREIRANIQTLQVDRGVKVLVFSSAHHKEGKTHTVVNTARFLAQHENRRTLLIDCDLRRPKVKNHIFVDCERYLEDVLTEKCALTDAIVWSEHDNLALLITRRGQQNATEMLETPTMKKVLETVRHMFDIVLIDTPPMLSTTDPMVLGAMCDGVITVVKAGATQRESIEHAISLMYQANAKVLGVVLTQMKNYIPRYLYRYHYFNDIYSDFYERQSDADDAPRKSGKERRKKR